MSSRKNSLLFRLMSVAAIGISALWPGQEAHAFDQCHVCLSGEDCPVFLEDYDAACKQQCNPHSYAGACSLWGFEDCGLGGGAVVCYLDM